MGVAVLSPENCLRDGFSHHHRRLISPPLSKPSRSSGAHNPKQNPNPSRSARRKQRWSPAGSASPSTSPVAVGQVRILKRGEDLSPSDQLAATPKATPVKDRKTKREGSVDRTDRDPTVSSTGRIGLDLESTPRRKPSAGGFYAGSAFFTSPPPSSVPLPAFFTKKIGACSVGLTNANADDAAADLRRILRLES